jgi:lipoprotein-anchoring transpeptidase ErfK/SrfK
MTTGTDRVVGAGEQRLTCWQPCLAGAIAVLTASKGEKVGKSSTDRSRRGVAPGWVGLVAGALSLALVAGCGPTSSVANAKWQNGGTGGGSGEPTTTPSSGPSTLTASVAPNASGVSPADPITVTLSPSGSIDSVSLTNSSTGKPIAGTFAADHLSWHSTQSLGYDTPYALAAEATDGAGAKLEQKSAFRTVKPRNKTLAEIDSKSGSPLGDHPVYGVGQVVVVRFDESIPDRAAAERSLKVTAVPAVVGAWSWVSSQEVHFRPVEYWTPGTKVTVAAAIYGRNLGQGLYGQANTSASFTVGPSHIAIADSNTHHMKIYINGVEQTTINGKSYPDGVPISMGRTGITHATDGSVIDFRTNSGPHVVIDKRNPVQMSSASYGLSDPSNPFYYPPLTVYWAVRISEDGEFVHSAPWSVDQQGHANVSHGCINAAPAFAEWFYNTWQLGDIVDVRNTGKTLAETNGLGDWTLSWAQWLKSSKTGQFYAGDPDASSPGQTASPTPSITAASPSPSASAY